MKLEQTGARPEADNSSSGKVLDLTTFRRKKETDEELARGRQPLYASHLDASQRSHSSQGGKRPESQDFGDRLQRIRSSLEKINRLMSDLKKMSTSTDKGPNSPR